MSVGYPWRRLKNSVANAISYPSRAKSKRKEQSASQGIKAVKTLRQMKNVPADPKTKVGREKLRAMGTRDKAVSKLKRRKK